MRTFPAVLLWCLLLPLGSCATPPPLACACASPPVVPAGREIGIRLDFRNGGSAMDLWSRSAGTVAVGAEIEVVEFALGGLRQQLTVREGWDVEASSRLEVGGRLRADVVLSPVQYDPAETLVKLVKIRRVFVRPRGADAPIFAEADGRIWVLDPNYLALANDPLTGLREGLEDGPAVQVFLCVLLCSRDAGLLKACNRLVMPVLFSTPDAGYQAALMNHLEFANAVDPPHDVDAWRRWWRRQASEE